jgi:hypothetical protein
MKNILTITLALAFLMVGIGCGSEECQTCTVTQVATENGVEIIRQTLNTNQEFCGDSLDAIKASESNVTQDVGVFTIVTVTTVDCK